MLADDLDTSLLRFMPEVARMQAGGADFSHYSVANSLCCPSRATILTGRYPHNTTIFANSRPDGGYARFRARGLEQQTYAVALQRAGYRTGFVGKYLNGYRPDRAVPPGWDTWAVTGDGYRQYDYTLNVDGRRVRHGHRPFDYLTDVLAATGEDFIRDAAAAQRPFALEVSTFAPHAPYTPAHRDRLAYAGLKAPRGGSFDETRMTDKPRWLRRLPRLSDSQLEAIDQTFRKRAQSVRSIDAMLARLRFVLADTGQLANTYVVFSSDNGYHLGQHRLPYGKQSAFGTDVVVPLIITGPGVVPGRIDALAQNVDLAPTFAELAGAALPRADGRSLLPLLRGSTPADWRRAALVEHRRPSAEPGDPDYQPPSSGNPPTYAALLTGTTTYVRYDDGEREFYRNDRDPAQLTNRADTLSRPVRQRLDATLKRLTRCRGTRACQVR